MPYVNAVSASLSHVTVQGFTITALIMALGRQFANAPNRDLLHGHCHPNTK